MNDDYIVFGEDTTDEKLCERIDQWVAESQTYHDFMLLRQNKSVDYYHGKQTDVDLVPPYNSNTVFNRLFEAIETIIPIVTGSAHQFIAMPAEENDISMARAQRVSHVLQKKYEDLEVRRKLENVARDMILKRFGVLEYGWDVDTDDIGVWVRDPRTILIPKLRVDAHELPYVIKVAEFDEDEIRRFFPDVDANELVAGTKIQVSTNNTSQDARIYQVLVCYTPEYWVWKQGNKVLKKMANPYYDFEGEEELEVSPEEAGEEATPDEQSPEYEVRAIVGSGAVRIRKTVRHKNHLPRPEIPLIFATPFTSGEAPVAETSLAEIAIPIQDDINISKRQILDNLRRMGNGQIYIDAGALPEEIVEAITNEPGLILQGNNLASENRIRREPATAIPASHFSNLQDSIVAFDNVFGTHGALRGAATNETLGGQIIDRQQNLSRIDQLTRELNRTVARLVDGFVQMMKMYYTEEKAYKLLGRDGAIQFIKFINDDIEDGIVIDTKSGTPPILDPVQRFNQAIQLWQLGALDPESLFERLEFPDPQMTAQKLAAWKAGQLLFESQVRQQEAEAQAQAQAQAQVATQGTAGAAEDAGIKTETDRNVETASNVIDRAMTRIDGGGKAPLTNTPNM